LLPLLLEQALVESVLGGGEAVHVGGLAVAERSDDRVTAGGVHLRGERGVGGERQGIGTQLGNRRETRERRRLPLEVPRLLHLEAGLFGRLLEPRLLLPGEPRLRAGPGGCRGPPPARAAGR